MKKQTLFIGIGYLICGIICLTIAVIFEFSTEGFLWGLGGAGIGPGILMIFKYIYWSKPQNIEEYNKRLKVERIEMADERKVMLRDKSGRITYLVMIGVYSVLIIIFSFLNMLGQFTPFSKYVVLGLSILLVFQFICTIFVFNYLNKRL